MPELRWILLGLGVLFCLGLWWWESRRGRQAADSRAGLAAGDLRRPSAETPSVEREGPVRELRPWNETVDIEEEQLSGAVPAGFEAPPEEAPEIPVHYVGEAHFDDEIELAPATQRAAPEPALAGSRFERARSLEPTHNESDDAEPDEPMVDIAAERPQRAPHATARIEPVIGDFAAAVGGSTASAPPTSAPQPRPDKIVTLRVAAPPLERFEGRALVAALRAAGLEHGKFSIFHKLAADGATLFSVASLVEPGTFDLQAIDGRRFPGVSFFTVLSATPDGSATVEDMLGTARTLATTLHGTLQDERGAPLSPQRLADLRADVADWMRQGQ